MEILSNENPEISKASLLIIRQGKIKSILKMLDEEFDKLSTESDKLIESPEANQPEVMAKRKEIAKDINEILDFKIEFEESFDQLMFEAEMRSIPKDVREQAENLAETILDNIQWVAKPNHGLN